MEILLGPININVQPKTYDTLFFVNSQIDHCNFSKLVIGYF